MIIIHCTTDEIIKVSNPAIRFAKDAAEHASVVSHALRDINPSVCVWLVPGTEN